VKHTVTDTSAQERTHPAFWNLSEQFKDMARSIKDLRRQEAFIKLQRKFLPGTKTVKFKTPTLPRRTTYAELRELKERSAELLMKPLPAGRNGWPGTQGEDTPIYIYSKEGDPPPQRLKP
jgi:hypothetical protein